MYIPKAFQNHDSAELIAFMRANSFATLVSILDGAPFASHIPLIMEVDGESLKLTGHLAKANPHAQAFGNGETLAIFTGPHAYISPALYEKQESVPTWNYIAVHAYGSPVIRLLDDSPQAMEVMLSTMINTYDAGYHAQWEGLSPRYREGMMQGIVAFEMIVTRLEGKYKLSQNRSHADQMAVAHALSHSSDPAVCEIGAAMQTNLEK